MGQIWQAMASAADSGAGTGGISPLFFVAGAVALIVVSTLGPLSRIHERRSTERKAAARKAAEHPVAEDGPTRD